MSHFIITGGTGGRTAGAAAPNRLEINTLIQKQEQFSLYIQALNAIYTTPQSNPLSFFQIGGIHGLPYVQWEGAGSTHPVQGSQWGGYCTHGSVLFPTWHRPYVTLFEQVLQQHALDIAKTYKTDPERWLAAAQNLRAPYWDWATNSVPPPEVISQQTVSIITPDGQTTPVPNPLYHYTFNPIDPSFPAPWKDWRTTIRHPDNPNSPNATTDAQALINDLQSVQDDLTTSTYNLLVRVRTWPAFSNHTVGDGGSSSNSLEAIHDEIHGIIGGQMGYPSVAGFDPIFFLHHCNVDRLLSLWSAVHPKVWVSKGPAEGGTFTIPASATLDSHTPLTPFWNSQSGYWASSGTTATSNLHYSYPEFNGLNLGNANAVQVAIGNYIKQQYGGGQFSLKSAVPGVNVLAQPPAEGGSPVPAPAPAPAPAAPKGRVRAALAAVSSSVKSTAADIAHRVRPGSHTQASTAIHDWAVQIHAKMYELGHSYLVLIFLGDVPADPSQWRSAPSFIGVHSTFVNTEAEQCANCREQAELVAEGFVHLNGAIAKRSSLPSFEPSVVVPYLRDNLHWRVQSVDRTAVDLERLPSLEVTVVSNILTHKPGALFPITGDPEYHHHITLGRQGGARPPQA